MTVRGLCVAWLAATCCLVALARSTPNAAQQGGDQFLDGIGETGLIARYVLAGNAEDSSRNQFHATSKGSGATFVDDEQFRRVLVLTGDGSHLQLPGETLAGEDTVSVTAWLFLPTSGSGPVFDFGRDASTRLYATASQAGFRAAIVVDGKVRGETAGAPVVENRWVHVAVVLDPANHALTTYLDGAKVGQAADVGVNAAQLVSQTARASNRLFVGRSQDDAAPTLHGRLRDVRIYRIALNDQQVGTIHRNALAGRQQTNGGRGAQGPEISTAAIPQESPLASTVASIPDITVNTVVGTLPHLPMDVPAHYRDNRPGPDVRVIWPSPTDNNEVLKPGTYSVTGKVPGTTFAPKATVIVKVPIGIMTPPNRLAEAFSLSDVLLDRDTKGRDTPFIRNRDKFIRGLAASNPDNFLYNFRDAFGQTQPAGAIALEGWDSQTTRLRGHATGHYQIGRASCRERV